MVQDHVASITKLSRVVNADCLNNVTLDYQEQKIADMERQLIVAENLELVSPEKLVHWRHILLQERQLLLMHKSKFSRLSKREIMSGSLCK